MGSIAFFPPCYLNFTHYLGKDTKKCICVYVCIYMSIYMYIKFEYFKSSFVILTVDLISLYMIYSYSLTFF